MIKHSPWLVLTSKYGLIHGPDHRCSVQASDSHPVCLRYTSLNTAGADEVSTRQSLWCLWRPQPQCPRRVWRVLQYCSYCTLLPQWRSALPRWSNANMGKTLHFPKCSAVHVTSMCSPHSLWCSLPAANHKLMFLCIWLVCNLDTSNLAHQAFWEKGYK